MDKKKRCYIYTRVSTEIQIDGYSLDAQREKLLGFAKYQDMQVVESFCDDGYSGTNYDRPDFQRMMSLVEEGKVGAIIVKDLSRLGRDYLKTGYYTEVIFPEYDVRFIAINDDVDTEKGSNEFAPFKNIINEWYAKNCRKKGSVCVSHEGTKRRIHRGLPGIRLPERPGRPTSLDSQ